MYEVYRKYKKKRFLKHFENDEIVLPPRHCGGGVSTLAKMVLGTYLEQNCPSSNGHLVDCGGVKMLARMVWGTYAVKIEVQMGICLC